ncbi:hypothetical protein BPTFM16_00557 [Altererythrobacter insulae]|nr:hypothetical protein BPTFM16_00557 [Altererythrobacter insulae]
MIIDAWKAGFSRYFDFSGTTSRPMFWYWVLATILVLLVLSLLDAFLVNPALGVESTPDNPSNPLAWLYSVAIIIPNIAIGVRRLRDAGHSPFLILLGLIPLLNLVLIYFFVQPTKPGSE